jgi:ferritin
MLSEKMQAAMNEQVNAEFYSAYLYLSMSAYFESQNLAGCANWMRAQALEEQTHAMKFFHHIAERGGRVTLKAIAAPPAEWDSPLTVFEHVLGHEQKVTGLINDLVNLALEEKDHASNLFLQWFVNEQVEEEASATDVLEKVRRVHDAPHGLWMLDRELGQRTFTPPAKEEGGD